MEWEQLANPPIIYGTAKESLYGDFYPSVRLQYYFNPMTGHSHTRAYSSFPSNIPLVQFRLVLHDFYGYQSFRASQNEKNTKA